jgi:hypothetical protein
MQARGPEKPLAAQIVRDGGRHSLIWIVFSTLRILEVIA